MRQSGHIGQRTGLKLRSDPDVFCLVFLLLGELLCGIAVPRIHLLLPADDPRDFIFQGAERAERHGEASRAKRVSGAASADLTAIWMQHSLRSTRLWVEGFNWGQAPRRRAFSRQRALLPMFTSLACLLQPGGSKAEQQRRHFSRLFIYLFFRKSRSRGTLFSPHPLYGICTS